jgi:hypothetical protein
MYLMTLGNVCEGFIFLPLQIRQSEIAIREDVVGDYSQLGGTPTTAEN